MNINTKRQLRFINIAANYSGSQNANDKQEWLSTGRLILRRVAKQLIKCSLLSPVNYKITVNPAGQAVLGDVTLHTDWCYVNIGEMGVMYRSCNGLKDYVGDYNRWLHYDNMRGCMLSGSLKSIEDKLFEKLEGIHVKT